MTIKRFTAVAAAVLALAACNKNSAKQMADAASQVTVSCQPEVLALVNNAVPATVTVTYPAGYFAPESKITVVPVLVYEGGEQAAPAYTYQGANVKENNRIIPSEGGSVTEKMSFSFRPGMEKAYLELRSTAYYKDKTIALPARKVADGIITTGRIANMEGYFDYKEDGYQHVVSETREAQIHYDVNSSEVKGRELRSTSFQDYRNALTEMSENDRVTIKDSRIISYASPEGGEERNAKLSEDRSAAARKAWGSVTKGMEDLGTPELQSVGQDWEGFQEAVAKSDIEDKDLILRVLSMYNDPEVRESEIRNMSQIFTELKKEVLPELRRSRFVTEIEYKNYTDEELHALAERKRLYMVDETALLRIAATSKDLESKAFFYRAAAERFGSQAGKYNLAITNLEDGKHAVTEVYLDQLSAQDDADVLNARGVVALRRGQIDKAEEFFTRSGNATAQKNLGIVALAKGEFEEAASKLDGTGGVNEAVAKLMCGKADEAAKALKDDESAQADYLRGVIAARKGKVTDAAASLKKAFEKDPSLRERALKDIELAAVAL